MAFLVICVPSGLSAAAHRRAVRAGPSSVASRHDVATLLRTAGWCDVATHDVTGEYLSTARAWLAARDRHGVELAALDPARLRQQQRDMTAAVAAIEAGLLVRSLVTARRAAPRGMPRQRAARSLVKPRGRGRTAEPGATNDARST